MTVAAVSFTSSGHLEAGNRLEVHHLQHLLGLSINLDDVLKESVGHVQLHIKAKARGTIVARASQVGKVSIVSRPLNMHTTWGVHELVQHQPFSGKLAKGKGQMCKAPS